MQEAKRILLDKRFFLVFLLVLALNGIFCYNQVKPDKTLEAEKHLRYGEDISETLRAEEVRLREYYNGMGVQQAVGELNRLCGEFEKKRNEFDQNALMEWDGVSELETYMDILPKEEYVYWSVIITLQSEYDYVANYRENIEEILKRAEEQQKESSVFRDDSFAGRNIRKTKEDFKTLLDIEVETGTSSGSGFYSLFTYNFSDFLMIFVLIGAVIVILDERKKGLWEFVYSMPNGRRKLAVVRIGIFAGISFLTALCVFLENLLIIGEVQGGFSGLSRAVQSIPECAQVLLPVNIWQYLGMMLFWKFLVLFLISLFLLFFVLTMKGYLTALFISVILLVGEYLAYLHIDFHSPFRIFKYGNLFAWLDAEWCMRQYLNFNVFGYPVGLYEMMCVFVPLLIVVFILLMLYSGNIRPFAIREGIWKKGMQKIVAVWKPYRHGNMLFFEYYKQFIVQKMGILVLAAFLAAVFYYNDNQVYYNYQDTLYNAYMEILSGKITEKKLAYLQKEQEIWQNRYEQELDILQNAENFNESQVKAAQLRSEQFEEAIFCVQQLETEAIRLLEQQKSGEQVYFVNKIAYEHLIGDKSMERNRRDGLLLLAFGTLFGAVLFSSEQAQNSKTLIKSTKNGRKKFLICKYTTLFTAELFIFLPVMISMLATVQTRYGMTWLSASIKSLPFAVDFPFDISIQNAIILAYTLQFLILYGIMAGITLLFGRMKNVMAAVLCGMAVFVLPAALWLMGFAQAEVLTILDELVVCGWLF